VLSDFAGNKMDLDRDRQVNQAEAEDYASSVGAFHCLTSAKLGRGIDECFLSLTKKMLEEQQMRASRPAPKAMASSGRIQVVADEPAGAASSAAAAKGCAC
jgi:Ras-related protein Rab-21